MSGHAQNDGIEIHRGEEPVLVSVIIPCFNQAHFLNLAIESVLAQTYPRVEAVVIDDGSQDNTPRVAHRYPQVRYVKQANQGLAAARNTGIRKSSGSYLVFLDADDLLLPTALEAGIACFREHPECGFVFGAYRRVTAEGASLGRPVSPSFAADPYQALLRGNYIAMHATVMYRREVLEAVNGFDTRLAACEDYDLYLRIARRYPVSCHSHLIAEYRWHEANMSHNAGLMLKTALTVLRSQHRHVGQQYREAYRTGIEFWKAYYGRKQFALITRGMYAPGGAHNTLRGGTMLLRYAPDWFAGYATRKITGKVRRLGFRTLEVLSPTSAHRLRARWRGHVYRPPTGCVHFGDLRRVMPISREYGYDRGVPIDRYYIESFLACRTNDIQGRVLEIGDNAYTCRFGGVKVSKSDVLHVTADNPQATFVGDLTTADHIPSDAFDCIVLTQTLHLIYDVRAALKTLCRILKPGGVLLVTFPGISQISNDEWGDAWCWGFTAYSARLLFEETFPTANVEVEPYGNVLAATAFLNGLATAELSRQELDHRDREYQVLITVRAVKPELTYSEPMHERWQYQEVESFAYGDDTTYRKGIVFLDGHGTIEDWGCGTAYAKNFVTQSHYIGIDGSPSRFADRIADLQEYTSDTQCLLMRHVLEHNYGWRKVLVNAVNSFRNRMALIVFTPFSDKTQQIANCSGIPDISFCKDDLTELFGQCRYTEETLETHSQYKTEHIFYLEK